MTPASNDKIYSLLVNISERLISVEGIVPKVNDMFKDIYIGNGERPIRDEIREWRFDKDAATKLKKDCESDKKDDKKWLKRLLIGGAIGIFLTQSAAFIVAFIKLLPFLEAIR
jgi:hypothetical protein